MAALPALVQPVRPGQIADIEKRSAARVACEAEATSRPLEAGDSLHWGGTVKDISAGGLGLSICYPFRLGTHLAIDLQTARGYSRTLVTRVVRVAEQANGTWLLGCEFVRPLSADEIPALA